jgi:hypothetical protein
MKILASPPKTEKDIELHVVAAIVNFTGIMPEIKDVEIAV